MKIQWSPLAVQRVGEIVDYIAQDDPLAAGKWVDAIFDRVKQLKDFSESGRYVPEVQRKDIRELIFGNYRIINRVEEKRVSVLTVKHFKQILPIEEINDERK